MIAALLSQSGFRLKEVPMPAIGPDQVLIQTIACGVCEGDLFTYRNREVLAEPEQIMGHEGTGTVVEVGTEVEDYVVGDTVTALNGAYADFFVASPDQLVKLPENFDPVLALGEPIACCVHAGSRFGIQPGDRVAVIGCGFMGLICLQLAKNQGAGVIYAFDPIVERQRASMPLGADAAMSPEVVQRTTTAKTFGNFDVVIEAAGTQSAIDLCGALVKNHGRITLVGYHQTHGGVRTVNMKQWNYKAIDVVNGHVRRRDEKREAMQVGMDLLADGQLVTAPLVTQYPLLKIEQAFTDLLTRKPGLFKVVLKIANT